MQSSEDSIGLMSQDIALEATPSASNQDSPGGLTPKPVRPTSLLSQCKKQRRSWRQELRRNTPVTSLPVHVISSEHPKPLTGVALLKTKSSLLRLCVVLTALAALLAVLSIEPRHGGYSSLPLAWHLRLYVLALVAVILLQLLLLMLLLSGLVSGTSQLSVSFELVFSLLMALLMLASASLCASTLDVYRKSQRHVTVASVRHLTAATVLGYITFLECVVAGFRCWLRRRKLRHIRFERLLEVASASHGLDTLGRRAGCS